MLKVASWHEPLAPRAGNFTTQPRNYTGVRAGGERGGGGGGRAPPPPPPPQPNLRQLRFFGQEEKFGQNQFLKKFPCFFIISKREIFYFNLKPAWYKIQLNRPFPSSPGPLYQNDVRCSTFDMEMIFHCHVNNKTHFHKKG